MKIKLQVTDPKSRDEQVFALLCSELLSACVAVFKQFDWDFDFDEEVDS